MTGARHRSAIPVFADPPAGPELAGKAPIGMWWVAWRQHRMQIAVTLALIAVVIAALIAFREIVIAAFTVAGCDLHLTTCADAPGRDLWYNEFNSWYSMLRGTELLAPIVLGVFVGAPIFTREFSRGTHIFALTQSIGRLRWWAVKVTVAGVPLLAGLVVLGFVTGWVDSTTGYTAHDGFGTANFAVRGIIPVAHGLAAFAIAVTAGIVTRSTVASLVSGLIVAGIAVVGMILVKPQVLPATRQVTPIEATVQGNSGMSLRDRDPDLKYMGGGYLAANGRAISARELTPCYQVADNAAHRAVGLPSVGDTTAPSTDGAVAVVIGSPQDQSAMDSPQYQDAYNHALLDCADGKGIVAEFQDYLPGGLLWPLRWTMTGIAAILAALFLIFGAARLPAAVAKR